MTSSGWSPRYFDVPGVNMQTELVHVLQGKTDWSIISNPTVRMYFPRGAISLGAIFSAPDSARDSARGCKQS